jgi:tRNA pseudouridine55 synthase
MDGLLIVDKPPGPTSHDVVARARRILRQRRIGHTGTLDPMASGVLPLVIGRATRLARFLTGDKTYEAVVRLGFATDTCDALGEPATAPFSGPLPDAAAIDAALEPFRGTFLQQPPVFSAKKIGGERSYAIARRAAREAASGGSTSLATAAPLPKPVEVTAYGIDLLAVTGDRVTLRVRCSAGFYIRSLANDLGVALGTGAHLAGLRRVEAVGVGLHEAVPFDVLDSPVGAERAAAALIPLDRMLPELPRVVLTDDGVRSVRFGREIGPADTVSGFEGAMVAESSAGVRLTTTAGELVAIAGRSDELLHPSVVLI